MVVGVRSLDPMLLHAIIVIALDLETPEDIYFSHMKNTAGDGPGQILSQQQEPDVCPHHQKLTDLVVFAS